jgi:uncharacterized protein with HEPN domain
MLDSTIKGSEFIRGYNLLKFKEDEKTQFAIIRVIEIIGEASKKVPENIRAKYPDVPWR